MVNKTFFDEFSFCKKKYLFFKKSVLDNRRLIFTYNMNTSLTSRTIAVFCLLSFNVSNFTKEGGERFYVFAIYKIYNQITVIVWSLEGKYPKYVPVYQKPYSWFVFIRLFRRNIQIASIDPFSVIAKVHFLSYSRHFLCFRVRYLSVLVLTLNY